MRKCNVRIEDKTFQEMHHALGCPWPDEIRGETYRNYFAIDADSDTAARMRASPNWSGSGERWGMVYFHVTDHGKEALAEYLRTSVEIPARYAITYHHYEGCSVVPARSRSAAKYAAYLNADSEDTFFEYAAQIKAVRLHSHAHIPAQSK